MLNRSWQIVENLMSAMSHCEIDAALREYFVIGQLLLIAAFFCMATPLTNKFGVNSALRPKGSLNNLCKEANDFLVGVNF